MGLLLHHFSRCGPGRAVRAIGLGLLVGAIGTVGGPLQSPARSSVVLTVDPQGNDAAARSGRGSFRTITSALDHASQYSNGVTIRLAPGRYSAELGEQFPLRVPDGVTLNGDLDGQGQAVVIQGVGGFSSRSFSQQAVAIALTGSGSVLGVTVSNPVPRGTGIWVESDGATPVIANNRLLNNHRDGIFVTGRAQPQILRNWFQNNGGNGLSITRDAGGIVRENRFQATGFGLAIGGNASPVIQDNQITQNRDGVVISNQAQPLLRRNQIEDNSNDGLVMIDRAQPDLGTAFSPGENRILNNGRYAIYNATKGTTVSAVGNELDRSRVMGSVLLSWGGFGESQSIAPGFRPIAPILSLQQP